MSVSIATKGIIWPKPPSGGVISGGGGVVYRDPTKKDIYKFIKNNMTVVTKLADDGEDIQEIEMEKIEVEFETTFVDSFDIEKLEDIVTDNNIEVKLKLIDMDKL